MLSSPNMNVVGGVRTSIARWWPFGFVIIAYAVVALQQIDLPGIYMDSVNPDYMVVRVINSKPESVAAWLVPGNFIAGRFPVLITFYHGSQQFWLGLPFFWLFGTSVTGIRLTHAVFALAVLFAVYAFTVRNGLKSWQAALACSALAIDPAFSYAFRTQSYITLAPAAWLFLSLYALSRSAEPSRMENRWLFLSGLCYGLATVGYFIYGFFLPAMIYAVHSWRGIHKLGRAWVVLLIGVFVGGVFYAIGFGLAVRQLGGLGPAWQYFQETQRALNAFSQQPDLVTRLLYLGANIDSVFQNWYHHTLIFGERQSIPGGGLKQLLLLCGPVALLYLRRPPPPALRVLVGLGLSFIAIAALFGTRLSGHHFMVLLPLSYAALSIGLMGDGQGASTRQVTISLALVPIVVIALINVGGQFFEGQRLAETRGVGLYSDAINRLAIDLEARDRKPFVYAPDWGLLMPIAILTGGRIGVNSVEDFASARRTLCEGRDVAVAIITGDRAARIDEWQRILAWESPNVVPYRQANGQTVFELATFQGRRDASSCSTAYPER